jgi:hypothetical protein
MECVILDLVSIPVVKRKYDGRHENLHSTGQKLEIDVGQGFQSLENLQLRKRGWQQVAI